MIRFLARLARLARMFRKPPPQPAGRAVPIVWTADDDGPVKVTICR